MTESILKQTVLFYLSSIILTIQIIHQHIKMEGHSNLRKLQMKKPSNIVITTNNERPTQRAFLSPRLIRRKTENKQKQIQKPTDDISEMFCYISPHKNFETIMKNTESTASLAALCGSPRSKIDENDRQRIDQEEKIRELSVGGLTELQTESKLKQKNKELLKKAGEYEGKIERLKQQNAYCFSKIEELTTSLREKQKKMKIMEQDEEKIRHIFEGLQESQQVKQNQIIYLQDTIIQLNRNLQEKNSTMSFCEDTDDGEKSLFTNSYAAELESQIEDYKKLVFSLNEKVKYYEIRDYLYKKLLSDHQEEKSRNEKLKALNRKLLRKVESFQRAKKKQSWKELDDEDENSISFNFSPCK